MTTRDDHSRAPDLSSASFAPASADRPRWFPTSHPDSDTSAAASIQYPSTPPQENYHYDASNLNDEPYPDDSPYLAFRSTYDRAQAIYADIHHIRHAAIAGGHDPGFHARINRVQELIRGAMRAARRRAHHNFPGQLPLLWTPETPPQYRPQYPASNESPARVTGGPTYRGSLGYRSATHGLFFDGNAPAVHIPSHEAQRNTTGLARGVERLAEQYRTDDPEEIPHSPASQSLASIESVSGEHNPNEEAEPQDLVHESLSLSRDAQGRPSIRGTAIAVSTPQRAIDEITRSVAARGRIVCQDTHRRYVRITSHERAAVLNPVITYRDFGTGAVGQLRGLDDTSRSVPSHETNTPGRAVYTLSNFMQIRDRLAGIHDRSAGRGSTGTHPAQTPPHAGPSRWPVAPTPTESTDGRMYSPQGEAFLDMIHREQEGPRRQEREPVTPPPRRLLVQPIQASSSVYSRSIGGSYADGFRHAYREAEAAAFENAVRARVALHAPRQDRLEVQIIRLSPAPRLVTYDLVCRGTHYARALIFDWRSGRNLRRAWNKIRISGVATRLLGSLRCWVLYQLEV